MFSKNLENTESPTSWPLGTRLAWTTEARVKALMMTRGPSAKTMRTQPGGQSVLCPTPHGVNEYTRTFEGEVRKKRRIVRLPSLFCQSCKHQKPSPSCIIFAISTPDTVPTQRNNIHVGICHASPTNDPLGGKPIHDDEHIGYEDAHGEDYFCYLERDHRLNLG